jgi:hypothetical protein
MFSERERHETQVALLDLAGADERITGVAVTGSASVGGEDRWSDIDLSFGIREGVRLDEVIRDWTNRMYEEYGTVHHLDVPVGNSIYRVFLLTSTLQVDVAFCPQKEFRASGPTFRLLHGVASEPVQHALPMWQEEVGLAWLHALHARSSIERGRIWQAEYMISGMRNHVLTMMCLRHGVSPFQGRGLHLLPSDSTDILRKALVRSLDIAELRRAFMSAGDSLFDEIRIFDSELASRLSGPLKEMTSAPQ